MTGDVLKRVDATLLEASMFRTSMYEPAAAPGYTCYEESPWCDCDQAIGIEVLELAWESHDGLGSATFRSYNYDKHDIENNVKNVEFFADLYGEWVYFEPWKTAGHSRIDRASMQWRPFYEVEREFGEFVREAVVDWEAEVKEAHPEYIPIVSESYNQDEPMPAHPCSLISSVCITQRGDECATCVANVALRA